MQGIDLQIERMRLKLGIGYIDTILEYSLLNECDFEDIVSSLHKSTKEKIKLEFVKKNMVRGQKHVPTLEKFFD